MALFFLYCNSQVKLQLGNNLSFVVLIQSRALTRQSHVSPRPVLVEGQSTRKWRRIVLFAGQR